MDLKILLLRYFIVLIISENDPFGWKKIKFRKKQSTFIHDSASNFCGM